MGTRSDPVSPAEIDEMAALVNYDLFGPTGAVWLLPPKQRALMVEGGPGHARPKVNIFVEQQSSPYDRELVHAGPGDQLLGLYTSGDERFDGQPTIQIFADASRATATSPSDIAIHEMGHVLDFNHTSRVGVIDHDGAAFTVCVDCEPRTSPSAAHSFTRNPDCPLCLLSIDTAVVEKNLDGIRTRAHLQHQIPLGLGGLLVETRTWVADAVRQLSEAGPLVPQMGPELALCAGYLGALGDALQGMLSPEQVSTAHTLAYKAWDSAFDLAHGFFLHLFHGRDADSAA